MIVQPYQTVQNLQAPVKPTENIWVFVEHSDQLPQFMPSYKALKAKLPEVSSCLMAPKGFGVWRTSLKGMRLLRDYATSERVLENSAPLNQPMQVLYDPPVTKLKSVHGNRLRMLVKGTIQGLEANILLDTGATESCISNHCVELGGLDTRPATSRTVTAFNGSTQKTSTRSIVDICLNTYRETIELMIVHMHNFDMILGQDWLLERQASLHFAGKDAMYFFHGGLMHAVTADPDIHINWAAQSL